MGKSTIFNSYVKLPEGTSCPCLQSTEALVEAEKGAMLLGVSWFGRLSLVRREVKHQNMGTSPDHRKKTCGKRCFNQWTMVILPSKIRVSPVKIEKTKTYSNHQQFKCSYQSHDRWECNHWKGGEILDLWLYDFYHTCLFNYFTGKGLGVMVENSL